MPVAPAPVDVPTAPGYPYPYPPAPAGPAVLPQQGLLAADEALKDLSFASRFQGRTIDDSSRNLERALQRTGYDLVTVVRALDGTPVRDAALTQRLLTASGRAQQDSGVFYTSNVSGRNVTYNGNYVPQAITDVATARGYLQQFSGSVPPYPPAPQPQQ